MIKYFCDLCKKEIKESESERLKIKRKIAGYIVEIEVMVGIGGVMNAGIICHSCIKKIISS